MKRKKTIMQARANIKRKAFNKKEQMTINNLQGTVADYYTLLVSMETRLDRLEKNIVRLLTEKLHFEMGLK